MDASEVKPEELKLGKPKFVSRAVMDKLEAILENIEAPGDVKENIDLEKAEIYKLKDGLLALGKNFLLDGIKNRLFIFNKPSARELILKYIGRW